MAVLSGQTGAPDWVQGILNKRQSYTAPTAPAQQGGVLGGLLSGAGRALPGLEDNGAWQAMLGILGKLGLGAPQGQSAPASTPAAARPAPIQFDPNAYLQSRGVNLPQAKMPWKV